MQKRNVVVVCCCLLSQLAAATLGLDCLPPCRLYPRHQKKPEKPTLGCVFSSLLGAVLPLDMSHLEANFRVALLISTSNCRQNAQVPPQHRVHRDIGKIRRIVPAKDVLCIRFSEPSHESKM